MLCVVPVLLAPMQFSKSGTLLSLGTTKPEDLDQPASSAALNRSRQDTRTVRVQPSAKGHFHPRALCLLLWTDVAVFCCLLLQHTLTPSLTHTHTHTHTHSLTHSHTHSHTLTHSLTPLTHSTQSLHSLLQPTCLHCVLSVCMQGALGWQLLVRHRRRGHQTPMTRAAFSSPTSARMGLQMPYVLPVPASVTLGVTLGASDPVLHCSPPPLPPCSTHSCIHPSTHMHPAGCDRRAICTRATRSCL